jgi:hydrogenase nickel incorporation protein HypA/HybF
MHEIDIAQRIVDLCLDTLDTLAQEDPHTPTSRVKKVKIRVGVLSSVVPQALENAFPQACMGSQIMQDALLEIETVVAKGSCPQHGELELDLNKGICCPICNTPILELICGEELELDEIECE